MEGQLQSIAPFHGRGRFPPFSCQRTLLLKTPLSRCRLFALAYSTKTTQLHPASSEMEGFRTDEWRGSNKTSQRTHQEKKLEKCPHLKGSQIWRQWEEGRERERDRRKKSVHFRRKHLCPPPSLFLPFSFSFSTRTFLSYLQLPVTC